MAALSLGLIFVGSAQEEIAESVLDTLFERDEIQKNNTLSRFFSVSLALLFIGQ